MELLRVWASRLGAGIRQQVPLLLVFFNVCSTLAYVTLADISQLKDFQQQTVMVVKAPEETKLEVPAPKEVNE